MNKENTLDMLKELYQTKKYENRLDKAIFMDLLKTAVKDIFPKIKEQYACQSIYGISFEIANTVQKTYADDYYTIIYLNTEERYQKAIQDCNDEDKKRFCRFCAWSEWLVKDASSPFFDKIQSYLYENGLAFFYHISAAMEKQLDENIREWYEKFQYDIDEFYDKERADIRKWLAQALGELRKEGFWTQQGIPDIYVIPFEGEGDISKEEMIFTFQEIDQGYHDQEYLKYLDYCKT